MPNLYKSFIEEGLGDESFSDIEGMESKEQKTCELYESIALFGRIWHWSSDIVVMMPIRRRNMLLEYLQRQLKKAPLTMG